MEPENAAFADERSADLAELSPYRGQNANMHLAKPILLAMHCRPRLLLRAQDLAKRFAADLASSAGGLIWEHYHSDWLSIGTITGISPVICLSRGVSAESSLNGQNYCNLMNEIDEWYLGKASELFDLAMEHGWDSDFGGIVYGFAPDGSFADDPNTFGYRGICCCLSALCGD